jgi:hypothetical protein
MRQDRSWSCGGIALFSKAQMGRVRQPCRINFGRHFVPTLIVIILVSLHTVFIQISVHIMT